MFELLFWLFVFRLFWLCFKNASWYPDPNRKPMSIPYMRRSTPYAARLGRKQAKTDYSGDDWGW